MQSLSDRGISTYLAASVVILSAIRSPDGAEGADRIVLRNLTVISDRTVASLDVDGVRLDNGSLLTWDEIEKATVAPTRQAEFDELLKQLGEPLYRIRQRLSTGDYAGLLAYAEPIYPRYAGRDSATAYMVEQSLMWGRLAEGRREAALEPYLRCLAYLRAHRGRAELPGDRRLQVDLQSGLTGELAPVWFDAQAARDSLPEVFRRIGELPRPRPPGAYVYYVSLALAAGELESARKVLATIPSSEPRIAELRSILAAQQEILQNESGEATAVLVAAHDDFSQANRPLAWYWLGLSQLASSDQDRRRQGALELLRIPALHGREAPELAAAALYRVMNEQATAGDVRGSIAVRRELLERYGQTYYAGQARAASPETADTKETP